MMTTTGKSALRGRERAPDLIEGHALWAACHFGGCSALRG